MGIYNTAGVRHGKMAEVKECKIQIPREHFAEALDNSLREREIKLDKILKEIENIKAALRRAGIFVYT